MVVRSCSRSEDDHGSRLTPALHIIWFRHARLDIKPLKPPHSTFAGGMKLAMGRRSSSPSFSSPPLSGDAEASWTAVLEILPLSSSRREELGGGKAMNGMGILTSPVDAYYVPAACVGLRVKDYQSRKISGSTMRRSAKFGNSPPSPRNNLDGDQLRSESHARYLHM